MPRLAWILLVLCSLGAAAAQAATKTFTGGTGGSSGDFSLPANWSGLTLPTAGDELLFDGTATATNITNVTGTFQRVVVARPSGSQALTFNLIGALALTGNGGTSIFVDVGESAMFQGVGGTRTISCADDVQLEGALTQVTFLSSVTLLLATGTPEIVVKSNAILTINGLLDVRLDTNLRMHSGAGASLFNVDLHAVLQLVTVSGTPGIAFNGTIRGMAALSGISGGVVMNISFNNCTIDRNGQNNFLADFSASTNTINGTANFTNSVAGGSWLTTPAFGATTIAATRSLVFTPGLGTISFVSTLNIAGTLNLGSNSVVFLFSITLQPAGTFNMGAVPGVVTLNNGMAGSQFITGAWSLGGQLLVQAGAWRIATGSSLTVAGSCFVAGGSIGADEDGATASGRATLTFNGNMRIDPTGGYVLGEGSHIFGMNVDFGFAAVSDDIIALPVLANNEAPQIHLTGGNVTFNFGGSNTKFFVTSVLAGTRVTSSGDWRLAGDFNLSAAAGGSTAPAWNAPGSQIVVGGIGTRTVTVGDRDLVTFRFRCGTSGEVTASDRLELVFARLAAATGILTTSFMLFGDGTDTVAGQESNGCVVRLNNIVGNLSATTVYGGNATLGGQGAQLEVSGGSLTLTDSLTTTNIASTTDSHSGAKITLTGATLTFSGGSRALGLTPYATLNMNGTSAGSTGGGWTMTSAGATALVSFNNCTLSATGGTTTLTLGGSSLSFVNTSFSNGNANGLEIGAGSTLTALSGCTFQNGTFNGNHITLNGLSNTTRLNCPGNQFDNSVNVSVAGGGYLVFASGNNPLTFQATGSDDFGLGTYTISAFTAEADGDNDGTGATEVQWQFVAGGGGGGSGGSGSDGGCTSGERASWVWLALLAALVVLMRRRLPA